jgi:ATP-dependent RNA helicase SUPV3L1/SUV3
LGAIGFAFSIYLPALLTPEARVVCAIFAELAHPGWRPPADALSALPQPAPPPEALALHGLRAVARLAAPVEALERLDALARATPQGASAVQLTPEVLWPVWAGRRARPSGSCVPWALCPRERPASVDPTSGDAAFARQRRR